MTETVKAALIGATGAVAAAFVTAVAQIIVARINRPRSKPQPLGPPGHDQNDEGTRKRGIAVKIFLGVIVVLLVAIGIFGFGKLSNELKNGVLVAAATIIVVLISQRKELKDLKKLRLILLTIIPVGGAALGIGVSRARQVLAAPASLSVPVCIANNFYPSGYMGDGEGENRKGTDPIDLSDQWTDNCHSDATCIRIVYHPASKKWAGVYWQYSDGNWGDEPGYAIVGAKKMVFWARGDRGGELVSFKVGGINK